MIARRWLVWGLMALCLLANVKVAHAQSPITLADYSRRVDQAIDLLNRALSLAPDARQPLLDQASTLILEVHEVQIGDGPSAAVDNLELAGAVRTASADPTPALERLKSLRATLAALPVAVSPADRARARDLLSRPPFKTGDDPLWEQLVAQINNFIDELLRNVGRGIIDQRQIVTLLGLGLAVAIIIFLLRNLRRSAAPDTTLVGEEGEAKSLTSNAALSRAQELARAGDYRTAVRQLYLGTLLLLDERGRLRFDQALTNREYLQAASRDPSLAAALQPVVDAFDAIWYGFERVTPEDFAAYEEHVQDVRRQVVL